MSAGAIASKVDYGFVLVDIAPGGAHLSPPPEPEPLGPPPPTFVPVADLVSEAEFAALAVADSPQPAIVEASADELLALQALPAPTVTALQSTQRRRRPSKPLLSVREATRPAEVDEENEDGPDPNQGEADDGRPLDWRATRARVALTRRRPPPSPAYHAAVA
jgi:hypothetical protein